jgi:undecaprenyl-diphosphatase
MALSLSRLLGAVWLGSDDAFGHTLWQTVDASVVSGIGATALKFAFGRSRPAAGQGSNSWFHGRSNESFPSAEVTLQANFVTPLIVKDAAQDPWVWALESLPVYDGIARMKSQAHWRSDVLAGWALGTATGLWAARRETALSVQLLPRGLTVGFSRWF